LTEGAIAVTDHKRRAARTRQEPAPPPAHSARRFVKALAALAAPLLFLAGLIALGNLALVQLRDHERYSLAFADINCPAPPGRQRRQFLDEVQYLGALPGRLQVLDADLPRRLAEAFALHPWVESVEGVEITPARRVHVRLRHRRPVLAVPLGEGLRAVDGEGVLLPAGAATDGLPVYPHIAPPPRGPAGTRWGDPAVEEAARAARHDGRGASLSP
jgi:hypothetical protein